MGTQLPYPKVHSPKFRHISVVAKWLDGLRCHLVWGLNPGDFVLDGDPALPPQKGGGAPPQFLAHVHCGQTAGWIMTALGTEVRLGSDHIVLDGDPAPLPKRAESPSPIFDPFLLWPNGWMHQDVTWYGGRPQHWRRCVRWEPRPVPTRGRIPPPPIFRPCLLWPNVCMDQYAIWY